MPWPGWLFRLVVALLFVVIALVAVGLGWTHPGLFFYVGASIVVVLVLLDYAYSRRKPRQDDHEAIHTTGPDVPKGGGSR